MVDGGIAGGAALGSRGRGFRRAIGIIDGCWLSRSQDRWSAMEENANRLEYAAPRPPLFAPWRDSRSRRPRSSRASY